MSTEKTFPEGFYLSEEVLRHFRETLPAIFGAERKRSDKVYRLCKRQQFRNL